MGSCASVHKEQGTDMGIRMRLVSKAKRLFVTSPTQEMEHFSGEKESKPFSGFGSAANGGDADSCLAYKRTDFGSKEEVFFDSKAWLDSDCDDDFFSVNGEFTPSRGSTPNHPKFSPGTPRMFTLSLNEKFPDTRSEPSPRKKLSQLFQEASEIDKNLDDSTIDNKSNSEEPKKVMGPPVAEDSTTNSPCTSNGTTPNREKKKRERVLNYGSRCCLPALTGGVGFDGRRQKANPSPCTV